MSKSSFDTSSSAVSPDLLESLEQFFETTYSDHKPGTVLTHDNFVITISSYSSRLLRKLTIDDVASIKMAYHDGITISVLARAFDVDPSCISQIVRGQTWKHVSVMSTTTGVTL